MREFNTRVAEGDYSITFETDDRKVFEQVQTLCRILIDGKDGDAIPIEWLKLKIDTVLNIYPNGNEETEVLCKLLYDWEKENGEKTV